jgi:hypothetical protein
VVQNLALFIRALLAIKPGEPTNFEQVSGEKPFSTDSQFMLMGNQDQTDGLCVCPLMDGRKPPTHTRNREISMAHYQKTSKNLGLAIVLAAIFLSASETLCQNQNQRITSPGIQNAPAAKEALTEKEKKEAERGKTAQDMIQEILVQSKGIANPVVRTKIRMMVGDSYWSIQPEKAREILSEEFAKLGSITAPLVASDFGDVWATDNEKKTATYKGVRLEEVKARLRRQMLAIISSHDAALARELLAVEKAREQDKQTAETMDEVLATAGELAATDPEAAAKIIRDSIRTGANDMLPFLLMKLRQTSPAEASAIFNQLLAAAGSSGDLWELERLVPYVMPTEEERFVGGKLHLTDAQRIKDALTLLEYASQLLYRRIQTEIPIAISPDIIKQEYFMWSNLQGLFHDLKPENVWLVNARLKQLVAIMPQLPQTQTQGSGFEERLQKLIAAADLSTGEKRDEYLNSAAFVAWRLGQGDLDEAVSLAEKIGSREMKELCLGTLYFQAGMKYLRTEGPDYALNLARKIDVPLLRVRLWIPIVNALNSVKAPERAGVLRDELLNWLRNRERNSDTAWAVLDYLETSVNDDGERKFAALEILVRSLNSPNLEIKTRVPHKIYWQPEFHDFRKSLTPLAKADFDRSLYLIQTLNNKEISMQVQAAFCGDYLKIQAHTKKAPPNVASRP